MYKMASNLVSIRRRSEKNSPNDQCHISPKGGNLSASSVSVNKVYDSILECVGNTPLIKLNRLPKDHGVQCEIYAKCEFFNPTGSIKDRLSLAMIRDAQKKGSVTKTSEFIEATSGNTGIGIAFNAALMGNPCIVVTEEKNSNEKVNTVKLLGATVVQTKDNKSEFETARQLRDKYSDVAMILNQFVNPANPECHYNTTAEEILAALDPVDVLVVGTGTGGTMTGIAKKLKEKNHNCLVVVPDPEGSTMWHKKQKPHPYLVEGVGGTFIPQVCDKSLIDFFEQVSDEDSFLMARELARKEGLLCGGSSGTAMCAAIRAAKHLKIGAGKRMVVILPDGIKNYMSKFVSDQWMEAFRFIDPPSLKFKWWNTAITDLIPTATYPKLKGSITCEEALHLMNDKKVNIAVYTTDDDHFVGAVSKDGLRYRATNPTILPKEDPPSFDFHSPVSDYLDKHVYTLAQNGEKGMPTIGLLSRMLDITPYVITGSEQEDKHGNSFFCPCSVVTGADVLDYIQSHP